MSSLPEVCNHQRHAHKFCRDFQAKEGELAIDEDTKLAIVGCVNCTKKPAIDENKEMPKP